MSAQSMLPPLICFALYWHHPELQAAQQVQQAARCLVDASIHAHYEMDKRDSFMKSSTVGFY